MTSPPSFRRALCTTVWLCAALFASCGTHRAQQSIYTTGDAACRVPMSEHELVRIIDRADAPENDELPASGLPYVEGAGDAWTKLYVFTRCRKPRASECRAALEQGEAWWAALRETSQRLFIETEAPDEDAFRAWTIERRLFFEHWLATPTPVLTMEHGVFRLSPATGAVFEDWARCAGDERALLRWNERTAK